MNMCSMATPARIRDTICWVTISIATPIATHSMQSQCINALVHVHSMWGQCGSHQLHSMWCQAAISYGVNALVHVHRLAVTIDAQCSRIRPMAMMVFQP